MSYRVLVVDDEPDLRESVGYLLEDAGYDVETASNGHEAIGAAQVFQPDVVLLDVMMPKENGYRVARRIHEAMEAGLVKASTKVVLLTARKLDQDPEREQMFERFAAPDQVIYKPFDPSKLVSRVGELIHGENL
jgi:two-component system alkaline phosphatase synthesis response regulator PhoP